MTALVGEAMFSPEASHQLSLDQTSSVGIKGTGGYALPGNVTLFFLLLLI
jgi:hypothetical protein